MTEEIKKCLSVWTKWDGIEFPPLLEGYEIIDICFRSGQCIKELRVSNIKHWFDVKRGDESIYYWRRTSIDDNFPDLVNDPIS